MCIIRNGNSSVRCVYSDLSFGNTTKLRNKEFLLDRFLEIIHIVWNWLNLDGVSISYAVIIVELYPHPHGSGSNGVSRSISHGGLVNRNGNGK
jgi:hypothetical protein